MGSSSMAVEPMQDRLASLSANASAEADKLQSDFVAVREVAADALKFFAMPAQAHEIDAKSLEFCVLLSTFAQTFQTCMHEIATEPELVSLRGTDPLNPRQVEGVRTAVLDAS